jgi:hypothetical protein
MKSFVILPCIALAAIAVTVQADDIQPYRAEPVKPYKAEAVKPYRADTIQPRNADAVQPRNAETIQPRNAGTVQPYRAPAIASTAVQGARVSEWNWQKIANTGVANGGLGRGAHLVNIRCAGLACSAYQETGGGWAIRGEGGFPEISGSMLDVRLMNLGTKRAQADARRRGVFSDGSFWDIVSTYQLPAGSYAVFYVDAARDKPFAAVTFDVQRHAAVADAAAKQQGAAAAGNAGGANQNLINQYQRNALCLGAAAMNPDVRCVPGG